MSTSAGNPLHPTFAEPISELPRNPSTHSSETDANATRKEPNLCWHEPLPKAVPHKDLTPLGSLYVQITMGKANNPPPSTGQSRLLRPSEAYPDILPVACFRASATCAWMVHLSPTSRVVLPRPAHRR